MNNDHTTLPLALNRGVAPPEVHGLPTNRHARLRPVVAQRPPPREKIKKLDVLLSHGLSGFWEGSLLYGGL